MRKEITREEFEEAAKVVFEYVKQQESNYNRAKTLANKLEMFFVNENDKLKECDLSVRCLNSIKGAELENLTIKELTEKYSKKELFRFRNFGKKSFEEVKNLVVCAGIFDWK